MVRRLSIKLLDAATSIGANLEEGGAWQTKPDFMAKNFISLKESRETRFWLRVIGATDPPLQRELQPFLQEANEFIAFDRPGFAKAATNFRGETQPDGSTRLTTETRVIATDAAARTKFGVYWTIIYAGSALIRREWLRAIELRAVQLFPSK